MTAISRGMLEDLEMPQDSVEEKDGKLHVGIDHFEERNGLLVPVRTNFSKKIGKALSPFLYLKPDVSQGDLLSPVTAWEDKKREGYQVVGRLDDSARMANHIDALRNALIMTIQNEKGVWETRYFPEGNLKPETWEEGNALLQR